MRNHEKCQNPARKVRLQFKEDLDQRSQVLNSVPARILCCGISVKMYLPLVICIQNIDSWVRCIGWLCICFTFERCIMSSINKRSTRVVGTLTKIKKWSKSQRGAFHEQRIGWGLVGRLYTLALSIFIDLLLLSPLLPEHKIFLDSNKPPD